MTKTKRLFDGHKEKVVDKQYSRWTNPFALDFRKNILCCYATYGFFFQKKGLPEFEITFTACTKLVYTLENLKVCAKL